MIRVCSIVTASMSLYYLHQGFFAFLGAHDVAVTGVAGKGPEHEWLRGEGVRTVVMPFSRRPSPVLDALCLLRLWWFLLWNRFDIVHVSTPKAALIGSLAARLSGHRRVVFTLRGRVYENATGWKHRALAQMDRLVCSLASAVVPICRELGTAMVSEGLCRPEKIRTIGSGSSNGIDARRFHRTGEAVAAGNLFRRQWDIPPAADLVLFVGRLHAEKGIHELVQAFVALAETQVNAYLALVGPDEFGCGIGPETWRVIRSHPRIRHVPMLRDPVPAYAAATLVALPSYREGFGNAALEASAMELPVVAADVIGCRESTVDGETGILVPPRDAKALAAALVDLLEHPEKRRVLGTKGRERVLRDFRQESLWEGVLDLYREIVRSERGAAEARGRQTHAYRRWGKPLLDVSLILLGLAVALPVGLVLALIIRITHGAPVLFCQERPGRFGKPFKLVKFRTMVDARDAQGDPLSDEQRLTRFGKFLRTTSLDELPELWNVLKGEMSLVGPRPLLMEYLPLYSPEQARRHEVRPGITGWAQVNGRNAISWEKKFALDVWYVDNLRLSLDLRVLWRTLLQVAKKEGIRADGHATMPKFMGTTSPGKV